MNYIKISKCDIANGTGVRVVLWIAGCSHKCNGCHNPNTWDYNAGKIFDKDAKNELFDALSKEYVDGITFSGGDPLNEHNIITVLTLVKSIKDKFPNKTIWLYTGYTWEQIMNGSDNNMKIRKNIINLLDILVDGPFEIDKKDITLLWKGSSNQRVIDVQKTLKEDRIVCKF